MPIGKIINFLKNIIPFFVFLLNLQVGRSSEFFETVKEDFTSPVTTNAFSVLKVGAGLTLLSFLLKKEEQDFQKSLERHRPLKKTSKYGDFLGQVAPNIAYALFMGGDYLFNADKVSLDRAKLMAKATLYSGGLTNLGKLIISQRRPNGSYHSFPSGHTTTAFAFSGVVMMEHSLPLGIAANAMAAFVGLSRMNDNAHQLHDVLAGATIGTVYGMGVYYTSLLRKQAETENKNKDSNPVVFLMAPIPKGLAGNLSFNF